MNKEKSQDLHIRKCTKGDIPFIAEVCEGMSQLYDPIMPGAFKNQANKYREQGLPSDYDLMLLDDGNKDIGFIAYLQLCTDTYYLLGLYLIGEVQRKGYGTRALDVLRRRLNILQRGDLYLLVHKEAAWAINFYSRYGFKICGGNKIEATQELPIMKDLYINNTYLMSHKERRGQ